MRPFIVLLGLACVGCGAGPAPLLAARTRVMVHRGSTGPEGTVAGCERSIALGYEILEVDVRLTRDGHAVILHDATVDRTTDGRGPVAALTLAELRRLDAGGGARIPTVEELLRAVDGRAWVTLELKVLDAADLAVQAIRAADAFGWAVVRSQDLERLAALRRAEPRLLTGAMAPFPEPADLEAFVRRLSSLSFAAYTPRSNAAVTREAVRRFQSAGIAFWATLENEAPAMRRLVAMGVDGLITDRPDVLRRVLTEAGGR
ncbi:MAG TPA: glycerophosphodiester phosphodiesterase family protein [Planctomycetota bacterium]|nr:glycerophosphodiester phosphodiesterase family protein [Planctomycetota bacterium]